MAPSSIADLLAGNVRESLICAHADEGSVFRMHLGKEEKVRGKKPGDDGRNKYFVTLGQDSEGEMIGLVLIDSEINAFLPQCRKDAHLKVSASKYGFLDGKDRFVDCSDFKMMRRERFSAMFNASSMKGHIDKEDMARIRSAVASYEDASPKLLKRFGLL